MSVPKKTILVLDGHDGSGKTTLSTRLAEATGGLYVRPFVSTAGHLMLWSAERGDPGFAGELARKLIERTLEVNDVPLIILDRHWMTVFTLIAEAHWASWQPLPQTTLCWADIDTTMTRLAQRDETQQKRSWHLYYLRRYWSLAERFACNILRTDKLSEDEAFERLLDWSRPLVGS